MPTPPNWPPPCVRPCPAPAARPPRAQAANRPRPAPPPASPTHRCWAAAPSSSSGRLGSGTALGLGQQHQQQPAFHRRADPGRPDHQLAHHQRARAPCTPAARRDRQAGRPPRAGAGGKPDCEVSASKLAQFGIQWQGTIGYGQQRHGGRDRHQLRAPQAPTSWARQRPSPRATPPPSPPPLAPGRRAQHGAGPRINGQYYLGALANFLQNSGDANVLSTPT